MAKTKWNPANEPPDDDRQVIAALPDDIYIKAVEYLRPEGIYVHANTSNPAYVSLWAEMPESPFGIE